MKSSAMILVRSLLPLLFAGSVLAGTVDLETEGGAVWFGRNDVRIPGDEGTEFDMTELTGEGPASSFRLYATYAFNERHALRLAYAPLSIEGTGTLDREVFFVASTFEKGAPVTGLYRFDTYRVTYRWTFHRSAKWRWGLGGALLVRDAEIELKRGEIAETKENVGLVPLLHLHGAYLVNESFSLALDALGAAAPQGRAIDAALRLAYERPSGWRVFAGYRTLEGGADNDSVYTFAWLHYAVAGIGYRFR
ncbi:MAG: hypothetical protein JW958_09165 [Candidatus Eisenbacteria bacterium]|nr:hypothetical protein [Candidatus Eisenbacteria bacterium]